MSQVDLPTSIGYALKRTTTSLRAAMDTELRQCELSVSQYASLELLAQRPGLTNAELARGVFVIPAGHPPVVDRSKAGRASSRSRVRGAISGLITEHRRARLADASHRVAIIEQRMLAPLSAAQQAELHGSLLACAEALGDRGE